MEEGSRRRCETAKEYAVRLPLDDAARLQALAELFPGQSIEEIVTDLLQRRAGRNCRGHAL